MKAKKSTRSRRTRARRIREATGMDQYLIAKYGEPIPSPEARVVFELLEMERKRDEFKKCGTHLNSSISEAWETAVRGLSIWEASDVPYVSSLVRCMLLAIYSGKHGAAVLREIASAVEAGLKPSVNLEFCRELKALREVFIEIRKRIPTAPNKNHATEVDIRCQQEISALSIRIKQIESDLWNHVRAKVAIVKELVETKPDEYGDLTSNLYRLMRAVGVGFHKNDPSHDSHKRTFRRLLSEMRFPFRPARGGRTRKVAPDM